MDTNKKPGNDRTPKDAPSHPDTLKKQKYEVDTDQQENEPTRPARSGEEKQPDGTVINYEELEKERRKNYTTHKPKVDGVAGSE
jgi:hypothetical protein